VSLQVHPPRQFLGRKDLLRGLGELVAARSESPLVVALEGPRGAGTSAVAAELVDQARRKLMESCRGARPIVIHVDVSSASRQSDPTHAVAAELHRHFMPGEAFQGATTTRILWWFLRRLLVEGKPAVLWLDQVRSSVQTLEAVLNPLLNPGTLVEDAAKLPPMVVVLSGSDYWSIISDSKVRKVMVPILPRPVVREVVMDHASQLGLKLSPEAVQKVMDLMVTRGLGLSMLDDT
jgi:cytidylate kinase